VLVNGKIVTVDAAMPQAEAIAVRGDRIVAVGSTQEIEALVGDATRVVELGGRLVIPGFIEGHGHYSSLGQSKMILDLTQATTWDEIVAMVAEAVQSTPAGEWIQGCEWHQEKWLAAPEVTVDGSSAVALPLPATDLVGCIFNQGGAVSDEITRRDFVSNSSKLAMGAMIVPRRVLGGVGHQTPSDTLNIAIVGAGGVGGENAQEFGSENIVAVCDLDHDLVAAKVEERTHSGDGTPREKGLRWKEQYASAAKYTDFRVMLEQQSDIEAVLIATPDHAHAAIAAAAMRAGKHVYVQKPLTYTVHEARVLQELAESTGVVTQMGNQGHSSDDARLINEWVAAGVIGNVREVHVWTNRPIWSQGLLRPAPFPEDFERDAPDRSWWPGSVDAAHAAGLWGDFPVPKQLDWDLYLGPVARDVQYHPIYHPFHWRGWVDFGVGALGDMGAHLIDHPYWALDLGYPTSIESTSSPWGGPSDDPVSYPMATTVHYEFPRRGLMPPVTMHWYDGGLMPQRPPQLPSDVRLNREGGVIFVGERGLLMHETYGRRPRLFPEGLAEEAAKVPQSYTRIEDSHEMNWANACKGVGEATCPFSYASPLTEVMLLGLVALRTGQGFKIEYDAKHMRVTNSERANEYLVREYREGWAL